MGQLDGKVVLVTGASRGIGRATAAALAREGADLVLAARDTDGLQQAESAAVAHGVSVEVVPTDVTSEQQIEALFARTMERFGRLDTLVNNAGVMAGGPIDEIPTDVWDKVMAVNLRAPFLCTRAAFRIMKEQGGGRIINIGSISAHRVLPNTAAYSTSKFGLDSLTHSTALSGREFGITCGCLQLGNTLAEWRASQTAPMMSLEEAAATVVYMACQPPHVNILELIQLPRDQLYVGRG
ncbi:MAG: SDR family oxidoreductase [candidate division NC10 bacterium]